MVYASYNYSYWGESKPTYNWGASHCSIVFALPSLDEWLRKVAGIVISSFCLFFSIILRRLGGCERTIWQLLAFLGRLGNLVPVFFFGHPQKSKKKSLQSPTNWMAMGLWDYSIHLGPYLTNIFCRKLPRWHAFAHSTVHEVRATLRNLQGPKA